MVSIWLEFATWLNDFSSKQTRFLSNFAHISALASHIALLGFLPQFLSFTSPATSHLIQVYSIRITLLGERESVCACGGGTWEDRSTIYFFRIEKIFGSVQVQTSTACVKGECHCSVPLISVSNIKCLCQITKTLWCSLSDNCFSWVTIWQNLLSN